MKGQHRNVHYSRILVVGIALSVAAHFVLFELGRFDFGSDADTAEDPVLITRPETTADAMKPLRSPEVVASAPNPAGPSEIDSPDLPDALNLAEHPRILSEADAPVIPPLVPRPRIRPERLEQGFTPVRLAPRMALGSRSSGDGGGIGITILVGSGGMGAHGPTCHPTRLPVRYSRHGPASPSAPGFGDFLPRR